MFRIGEFSRIGQVSIKTLHHYDTIGLLKPAQVDRPTGYRLYTIDQLPRLHQILALKDLGFSLDQIADLLDRQLAYATIQALLELKQAELAQRVAEDQARLARIGARLRLLQQEGAMTPFAVVVRPVAPLVVLSARGIVDVAGMVRRLDAAAALAQGGLAPTGPLMTLFYHEGFREEGLDVEVAVPVAAANLPQIALGDGATLSARCCRGARSTCPAPPTARRWRRSSSRWPMKPPKSHRARQGAAHRCPDVSRRIGASAHRRGGGVESNG